MKGTIALGALVAATLALAVPATAAPNTFNTVRMNGSVSSFASSPDRPEVNQVPVPGTVALLALGGVGLSIVRRVKSRKRRD